MPTIADAPEDIDRLVDSLTSGDIFTEADKIAGGQFVRSRILDRTQRGVDVNGAPFAEYSEAYAKRKAAAGGRVDRVDLFGYEHHPHMLSAIETRVNTDGFEIGFYDDETAARAEVNNEGGQVRTRLGTGKKTKRNGKAFAVIPERRFFAANDQDLEDLQRMLAQRAEVRGQKILR